MDMDPTNDCASCAFAGNCADKVSACGMNPDCCDANPCSANSFVGCITACMQGDTACEMKCQTDHPTGAMLYNDLVVCVICQECPMDCNAAMAGCP
jgi:hypothetical protein